MSSTAPSAGRGGDELPLWLSSLLGDVAEGPRLYRWTAADVIGSQKSAWRQSPKDASEDGIRDRIYILGIGNIGRLFAAALAQLPDRPPITLVVHRRSLLEHWSAHPGLVLHPLKGPPASDGAESTRQTDFDVEMWSEDCPTRRDDAEIAPINNLVVATKAQDALTQTDRLRRYLGPSSTVAFAQNGINKLWPPYGTLYNAERFDCQPPRWLACVVTHGVTSLGPFESVLASPAGVRMGAVGGGNPDARELSFLERLLLAAPLLNVQSIAQPELWVSQLEKLAVNAVINPLTAILGCLNGQVFEDRDDDGDAILQIIELLLREASRVFLYLAQHDDQCRRILDIGDTGAAHGPDSHPLLARLTYPALRATVFRAGALVKDNTSSMLQDVRAGKTTEIRELNGWLLDIVQYLAAQNHVSLAVPVHEAVVALVEAGVSMTREQLSRHFAELTQASG